MGWFSEAVLTISTTQCLIRKIYRKLSLNFLELYNTFVFSRHLPSWKSFRSRLSGQSLTQLMNWLLSWNVSYSIVCVVWPVAVTQVQTALVAGQVLSMVIQSTVPYCWTMRGLLSRIYCNIWKMVNINVYPIFFLYFPSWLLGISSDTVSVICFFFFVFLSAV